jgi:tetratricopeptide (TPR) repeat protein
MTHMLNESRLELPSVPTALRSERVAAWREPLTIDTYLPDPPDRYPAYLENRVYQGSSGSIYPLPFHERISQVKTPHQWDAIHLENDWVRLVMLPELGGRIHVGLDKTNGYDFFYRNNVIKPALVGLAGPWVAGGVEFNWPQHHRPATFLPTDSYIEREVDGAVTIWCSDHDPFARMKGMHGIRLRPDSAVIELRARLFNRTEDVQSFLWWANAAVRVGDSYQSFFPTDVRAVADHAKRAVTAFPRADRPYYGIDYPARPDASHPDADRIDWYRNIPVPMSYMCVGTQDDFFGGYDHGAQAGFVHWADHRVAPGKKQWTWGNGAFGQAWDANLTDTDGPYVELMAGVFTDNQPDFAFLAPGETKTFSQYWYPIQRIGAVHQATLDAAVRLDVDTSGVKGTTVRVAVAVTTERAGLQLRLLDLHGATVWRTVVDAGPGTPSVDEVTLEKHYAPTELTVLVTDGDREVIRWRHREEPENLTVPDAATEPPAPGEIETIEELYLTGLHLEQYQHATRSPEPYWQCALERDPGDVRSNVALAARRIRAARYGEAEGLLRSAIERLTMRNPNPADGEAYFRLGEVLVRTDRVPDAYDAFGKAAWNYAWCAPSHLAMARIDATRGLNEAALAHARVVLAQDDGQLQARNLSVVVLRRLDRAAEAAELVAATLKIDPLDWWALDLAGASLDADAPTVLDIALEYASVGERQSAIRLFEVAASLPTLSGQVGVAPLASYHRSDLLQRAGNARASQEALTAAHGSDGTYCLASRLDDIDMLMRTCASHPDDARAWALVGHWLYYQRRYIDAINAWERSVAHDATDPVVWRNLALAAFNVLGDGDLARARYDRALDLSPHDARLLYELDQLAKRTGEDPRERLARLEAQLDVVSSRDDLMVEFAQLLTAAGQGARAVAILGDRLFQPWEGGEGQVLGAWDEAHLCLARAALDAGDAATGALLLQAALEPPASLGEGRHLLANSSHLLLALGDARAGSGDFVGAQAAWRQAATFAGDFQSMATQPYSEMTYYSVVASWRLGDDFAAEELIQGLERYIKLFKETPPVIDYFATSLPTMLLFTDDVGSRRDTTALILDAQVAALRGDQIRAADLIDDALRREPNRARALDLQRLLSGANRIGDRPITLMRGVSSSQVAKLGEQPTRASVGSIGCTRALP